MNILMIKIVARAEDFGSPRYGGREFHYSGEKLCEFNKMPRVVNK